MSAGRENRAQPKPDSADDIDLRKGKWTIEEENYANKIIGLFNQGMLPVVAGTTLRTYLSDKLRCDPMRITKKYAGASCIGKQVFQLSESYYDCFQENERELQRLENLFLVRINGKGLMGKRAGTGSTEPPTPHQSIYETTNFDQTPTSNALQLKRIQAKKKTPMKGSSAKSPGEKARRQQEYANYMNGDPNYASGNYGYHGMSGDLAHTNDGSDNEEGSDYGYSYDPDQEDHHYEELHSGGSSGIKADSGLAGAAAAGGGAANGLADGVYSSFRVGGRRVLSAPNLTELNLSNWKATDYRPMPPDSLKEMFSLPLGSSSGHQGEGEANSGGYTLGGADGSTSLLPEHVYHTLLESGRYSRNSNGGVGGNGGGGGSVGLGHSHHLGGAMGHSNGQGSHNNIMAARARATKAALHQHLQFQYPSQVKAEGYPGDGSSSSGAGTAGAGLGFGAGAIEGFSSFKAKKRSHSAMALVDFEKLAGDDTAAGDLFMQFLDKINSTSPRGAPRSTINRNDSGSNVGAPASTSAAQTGQNGDFATGPTFINSSSTSMQDGGGGGAAASSAASGAANTIDLPALPSIPSLPASYVPAADADNILPSAAASAAVSRNNSDNKLHAGAADALSAPDPAGEPSSQPMEEG